MSQASGSAWRGLVGNGPWRRGPAVRRPRHRHRASSAATSPARGPGQGVQLLGRGYQLAEGLKARRDRRRRGRREPRSWRRCTRPSSSPARPCARSCWRVSGGRPQSSFVRVDCRAARPCGDRGRSPAPARPRPPRGVERPSARCCMRSRSRSRIDGGRPLKDARGLSGQRLEIVAHLVTVAGPALRNLLACLERCHVEVKGVVCASYAAAIGLPRRGRAGARLPGPRHGRRHHRPRPFRRRPADPGRAGALWRRPHHGRSRLWPVDQPPACRADQEPVRRHAVPQLRRQAPGSSMPLLGRPCRACRPARCRAPGSPRSCARGSRRSWRWCGAGSTSMASCWLRRPPRSIVLTGGGSQLEGIEELVQEVFRLPARLRPAGCPATATAGGRALLRHGGRRGRPGAGRRRRPRLARSDRGLDARRTVLRDLANGLERTSDQLFRIGRPDTCPRPATWPEPEYGRPSCGGERTDDDQPESAHHARAEAEDHGRRRRRRRRQCREQHDHLASRGGRVRRPATRTRRRWRPA